MIVLQKYLLFFKKKKKESALWRFLHKLFCQMGNIAYNQTVSNELT